MFSGSSYKPDAAPHTRTFESRRVEGHILQEGIHNNLKCYNVSVHININRCEEYRIGTDIRKTLKLNDTGNLETFW